MAFEDHRVDEDLSFPSAFKVVPFEEKLNNVYTRYCGYCSSAYFGISERTIARYKPLVKEIHNFFQKHLWNYRYFSQIPEKIKFSRYYKRRDIARIFSEIGGLKITRYTNEYGRTIVHFEDASDSTK